MDSTRAIVRLWRQFAPASSEAQGGDGVIAADRVKEVLGGQLQNKVSALNGHSVDEVVQIYMQPDSTGVVGFLQFWRGMEEILRACGTQRSLLSPAQEDALAGFRRIRQCVLDWGAKEGVPTEQCTIQVEDLRYFIERSMGELGPDGQHFWRTRAEGLPVDEAVSGEEVAAALLVWLEHLLDEDDLEATNLDRTDMQSGRSRSSGSSSVDEPQFFEDDAISPVRSSARTAAPGLPPRSPDDSHSLLFSARTGTAQTPLTAAFAVGEGVRMEQQPPATPLGPPPRRSVQAPLRNSLGVDLRADSAAGRASLESRRPSSGGVGDLARRRAGTTPLEAALAAIVGRDDRRPASPTKAQAAEWREAIEFQVALRRYLGEVRAKDLEFTRGGFHDFARDHINATSGKRRPSKQLAPAAAAQEGAAKVLFAALEGLHSARLAHAFGALAGELRRTRRTAGPSVATLGGESSDIMRELLQAQCRASVELEHRVKMAGRVGGLVLCLASLQRTQLRYSWMRWTELAPDEWLPMPPELAGRGASPFAPPLPHQLAGGGQVAAARAVFAGAPEGSRSGSAASRGTPPPGRGGGGAVGHKLTE